MSAEPPTGRRTRPLPQLAAAVAAFAVAILLARSDGTAPSLASEDRSLDASGRLARAIAAEPVAPRRELLLARALVAHELDRSWLLALPESDRPAALEAGAARLERAGELARRAFRQLPSSWQAAMLVGATTHLDRRRRGDPKFFTRYRDWEAPLELAVELGPTQLEPPRYLLAAYLDAWRVLSPEKRAETRRRLATAFADPTSFRTLIQAWLSVAPSIEEGLELVPAEPSAWTLLRQLFAAQADWDRYLLSHRRYLEAAGIRADRELEALEAAPVTEEANRRRIAAIVRRLPVGLEFAERLDRALSQLPAAGLGVTPELGETAAEWLDWAIARSRFAEPPLSRPAMEQLIAATDSAWLQAAGTLVTGDLAAAEAWERKAYSLYTERWAPYLLLKAELLARRDRLGEARAALGGLSSAWVDSPQAVVVAQLIAELGDAPQEVAAALRRRDVSSATTWPAAAWGPSPRGWRQEILAATGARALIVEVDTLPRSGGAFALLVDGATVGYFGLDRAGAGRLEAELDAGLHSVELVPLSAGVIRPGSLTLAG